MLSNPSVTGVILLVPQHLSFFCQSLTPNLKSMTMPFDEILVIASGLSRRQIRRVEAVVNSELCHRNLRVLRAPLGSVGANRNRGLDAAASDLVTFIDSDDLYSPQYCEFLKIAYARSPYQILLHDYTSFGQIENDEPLLEKLNLEARYEPYTNEDFLIKPIEEWLHNSKSGGSTNLQFRNEETKAKFSQGHMTVWRTLPLRFHIDPLLRNEDGLFLQQCLSRGYRIQVHPLALSAYRLGSTANPLRHRFLSFVTRLRQVFGVRQKSS